MSNTKLVKYYKKLMRGVSKEEPRYSYLIEAYEQRIKQLQTEDRVKLQRLRRKGRC